MGIFLGMAAKSAPAMSPRRQQLCLAERKGLQAGSCGGWLSWLLLVLLP